MDSRDNQRALEMEFKALLGDTFTDPAAHYQGVVVPESAQGDSAISTWDVLRAFGFSEDSGVYSDGGPGLSFDFSNFRLRASRVLNRRFVPIVLLSGVIVTERTITDVRGELPREVESCEQAAAFIAWCLDSAEGSPRHAAFKPVIAMPVWLTIGRGHFDLLPWEQERRAHERERRAFEVRPVCYVKREWARLVLRDLAELLAAQEDGAVIVAFNGEVLTASCGSKMIAVAAVGKPWTGRYSIQIEALQPLPKRLVRTEVAFSIWDSALVIGNLRYRGIVALDTD